jgi:2-polyprenyl-3-methyl-5-hydroxy-6-metoxy-1,4-benzoquinol methylase
MSAIDPDKLKMFSFLLFTKLEGAVTSGMVHLGDQLGLYAALAKSTQPMTTAQLAYATELNERWVREWAYNQASARLISTTNTPSDLPSVDDDQFFLSPEQVAVLADPNSPAFGMGMFHRLPQTMAALNKMPESFRTGVGHDYDSHGPEGAVGIERSFEPWTNANLIDTVIPAIDGIRDALTNGATVADIGCGGYDISQYALDRAADKLIASGLTNVSFHDPRKQSLPTDNSVDFITTFDCIHDMTHPAEMMHAIRAALKPNGTWLLVDIKAHDTFALNTQKNPMAPLMYGISVLSCMSSAMSSPDGAGLGTLGLSAGNAESMAKSAGFSQFRRLDIDHSINAFYDIRP